MAEKILSKLKHFFTSVTFVACEAAMGFAGLYLPELPYACYVPFWIVVNLLVLKCTPFFDAWDVRESVESLGMVGFFFAVNSVQAICFVVLVFGLVIAGFIVETRECYKDKTALLDKFALVAVNTIFLIGFCI